MEALSAELQKCRRVLDRSIQRLVPLAVVAARRFRATSIFYYATQKKSQQMLDQHPQGGGGGADYQAVKALMEKRNEEETELLLIALQGLRAGLRSHARTNLRKKVRWLRERQKILCSSREEEEEERERNEEGEEDEEEKPRGRRDEEEEEVVVTEDAHVFSSSREVLSPYEHEDEPAGLRKKKKKNKQPEKGASSSPSFSEGLPELSPPPSIAYWLWMRTAMIEWEREKKAVSQFPLKWWSDAAKGRKASHRLYAELGREATEAEVAEEVGVSLEKWRDISLATKAAVPAEAELSHGGAFPLHDPGALEEGGQKPPRTKPRERARKREERGREGGDSSISGSAFFLPEPRLLDASVRSGPEVLKERRRAKKGKE